MFPETVLGQLRAISPLDMSLRAASLSGEGGG